MKKLTSFMCSLVFSHMAMAGTFNLNLNLGAAFSRLTNDAEVSPDNGFTNTYATDKKEQTTLFMAMGPEYSFDKLANLPLVISLGVSAYRLNLDHISGTTTPGANIGLTDTLYYDMQARSKGLMLEPRLVYVAYRWQPYVLAGVGYAWNTLSDFSETTPPGSHAVPGNPYANNTTSHVAYELGLGLQYPLTVTDNHRFLLKIEYRYLNLGTAKLGKATGQTTDDRLTVNPLASNIVLFGLSYQF